MYIHRIILEFIFSIVSGVPNILDNYLKRFFSFYLKCFFFLTKKKKLLIKFNFILILFSVEAVKKGSKFLFLLIHIYLNL